MHTSSRISKTAAALGGFSAASVLLVALPSFSSPLDLPAPFESGTPISADDMNERFAELYTEVNRQRHRSGEYCGMSTVISDASLGGYAGATALCQSAPGCSPDTAHFCTAPELIASLSSGTTLPENGGWVATGYADYDGGTAGTNDCEGFTEGTEGFNGVVWNGYRAQSAGCSLQEPVMCCD